MESILNYKRLQYDIWSALAEFIDNSTQSYFNNRQELDSAFSGDEDPDDGLGITIVYSRDQGLLRVSDNAMGMNEDELERAMVIGIPPENTTGRNEFGMGLKTAACWFGDYWEIRTKKKGEAFEYKLIFDVAKVAAGAINLEVIAIQKNPDLHYTVIEITQMHQKVASRTVGKVKDFLRSMYRIDTRNGSLKLCWDQEVLSYDDSLDILSAIDGTPYRREFSFNVGERAVTGWIAILRSGARTKAGLAVVRRGRVIQGQPNAWRPMSLFGDYASNDRANQRLVGEIDLDGFTVSHTKNAILWQGDEENDLDKALAEVGTDYRFAANSINTTGTLPSGGPTAVEIDAAVDELKAELATTEMADLIEFQDVPPNEVTSAAVAPLIENAREQTPQLDVTIGTARVKVYLTSEGSPNDPYYASAYPANEILVVVNTKHPYWTTEVTGATILQYLRQCVYDALAEWKCARHTGLLQADTIKLVKDSLMRQTLRDNLLRQ